VKKKTGEKRLRICLNRKKVSEKFILDMTDVTF